MKNSASKPPENEEIWYKVMWARPKRKKCALETPFLTYKGQIVGHTINNTNPRDDYNYTPTCGDIYQMDFAMSAGFSFMKQKSPPIGRFFDV